MLANLVRDFCPRAVRMIAQGRPFGCYLEKKCSVAGMAPVPPTRYRPDVPAWLEAILLKACAKDPAQRIETAEEFLLALERGEMRPLNLPRRQPLLLRNVTLTLKVLLSLSLLANLVLAVLLSL